MPKKKQKSEMMTAIHIRAPRGQIKTWNATATGDVVRGLLRGVIEPNISWWVRCSLNAAASGSLKVRFTDKQITAGLAELGDYELELLQFRATAEEKANWNAAAKAAGLPRAEWARQVLDHCATLKNQKHLIG